MKLNTNQNNYDEQLKMLCIAVEDKKTAGFILYKSNDENEQICIANKLSNNITKLNLIINASDLTKENLPSNLYNIKQLLKESNAKVVVICNIQKCREINKDYIETLNSLRDVLISLDKIWIFGMTNDFATDLSRKAPDLYSCIMNHFDFTE